MFRENGGTIMGEEEIRIHFGCVEFEALMRPARGEVSLELGKEVIQRKRSLFLEVTSQGWHIQNTSQVDSPCGISRWEFSQLICKAAS